MRTWLLLASALLLGAVYHFHPRFVGCNTGWWGDGEQDHGPALLAGHLQDGLDLGVARKIPAGARVSFQIHYTPSGKAKKERLRMGLIFAKSSPQYEVKTLALANNRIAIPPRASHHVETQSRRVPFDIPITSYMAHMHIRGKAFKYEVTYADGKTETLLDIPRYDFNWQLQYRLAEPLTLPRGTRLIYTAWYDNSPANPANPDAGPRWAVHLYALARDSGLAQGDAAAQLQALRARLLALPTGRIEVWVTHQVIMTGLTSAYPGMAEAFLVDRQGRLLARGPLVA